MSKVTVQEIVEALRSNSHHTGESKRKKELAARIEKRGIAPNWPPGILSRSKTLEILKRHNEWRRGGDGPQTDPRMLGLALDAVIAYIEQHGIAPPDGMVLVRKEPVAWRHWHPIELCFEYHLRPVCDRCDALYIAAAPEVKP